MEIKTNHKPRPIVYGWELTEKERAEFDYLDDINEGSFFRYKGHVYDLGEFMRTEQGGGLELLGWQGISTDSYFSGTIVRLSHDGESITVARIYS